MTLDKETTENGNRRNYGYNGAISAEDIKNVEFLVDLRSDTVTRPGLEMRKRMANAEVGDDVFGEDPTVRELEERAAKVLGKEASILVPSGTMGNLIALLVHCDARGSEVIVGDMAHMFLFEQGGMAQFGGIQANKQKNKPDGTFCIEEMKRNFRPVDIHLTKTSLICLENTHNWCGGKVLPQDWIDEVTKVAQENKIPVHMDGARLFNASIASGVSVSRIVRDVTSVNVCLSKGLGAPLGSLLCGDRKFIEKAKRTRKALGGGMRQVGIIAAAGLYIFDHMIQRLADDHKNTKKIADDIAALKNPIFSVDSSLVETNIMFIKVKEGLAHKICERLSVVTDKEKTQLGNSTSVLTLPKSDSLIRLVLHCDVSTEMVSKAAQKICYVANEALSWSASNGNAK